MALDPSLVEVLEAWFYERTNDLHVAMPGKVKSYDKDTQTADIIPVVKGSFLKPDGSRTDRELPVIPNVRVMWPRAGGAYIHLPMAEGDYVQLVFNEACIAQWRESGAVSPAGDLSRHDLSYPYAYPGGWPDAGAFALPPGASESYTDSVLMVPGILRVVKSASPSDQFVAGGEKVNTELTALQGYLSTFVGVLNTWLATFAADSATLAPVAPTMQPGAAAVATAAGTLAGQLGTWPAATVEMTALKTD